MVFFLTKVLRNQKLFTIYDSHLKLRKNSPTKYLQGLNQSHRYSKITDNFRKLWHKFIQNSCRNIMIYLLIPSTVENSKSFPNTYSRFYKRVLKSPIWNGSEIFRNPNFAAWYMSTIFDFNLSSSKVKYSFWYY